MYGLKRKFLQIPETGNVIKKKGLVRAYEEKDISAAILLPVHIYLYMSCGRIRGKCGYRP